VQLLKTQADKAAEIAHRAFDALILAQNALSKKPDNKRLQFAADKAQQLYNAMQINSQNADVLYQAALQAYLQAENDEEAAQKSYDESLALTRQPSVISGGDMILSGGCIGNTCSPLTVMAGGAVTVTGIQRILMDSKGNLEL
jgi:hypothetical protein